MFTAKKDIAKYEKLDIAIDRMLDALQNETPGTKEYNALADQLTKLHKLKELDTNLKIKIIENQLKQEESEAKQQEFEANAKLKDADIKLKDADIKLKDADIKLKDADIKLKNADAEIKLKNSEADIKLKELEIKMKEREVKILVKPDTLALLAGNLAGIALILGYEHAHVVTSKALGFVKTLR